MCCRRHLPIEVKSAPAQFFSFHVRAINRAHLPQIRAPHLAPRQLLRPLALSRLRVPLALLLPPLSAPRLLPPRSALLRLLPLAAPSPPPPSPPSHSRNPRAASAKWPTSLSSSSTRPSVPPEEASFKFCWYASSLYFVFFYFCFFLLHDRMRAVCVVQRDDSCLTLNDQKLGGRERIMQQFMVRTEAELS